MPLTQNDVDRLARLANIHLDAVEKSRALDHLTSFFIFVEEMRKVDTQDVNPLLGPLSAARDAAPSLQLLRPDVRAEIQNTETRHSYQSTTRMTDKGFYLVPKVIE